MDDNDTKMNANAGSTRFDQRRAALGAHHDLLLDRLTRRPEPLRPPRIAAKAIMPEAAPVAAEPQMPAARREERPERPQSALAQSAPAQSEPRQEERRKSPRRRMLKAGVLSFNGSFSGLKCTVRDLSDGGARVKIDQPCAIPDVFQLIIEIDGLYAKSSVAWRKATEVGVRFLEPPRIGAKLREQVITPRA